MANSWLITQLECYPKHEGKTDVVFLVHWRREASSNGYAASVYGAQEITLDPNAPFTPFNALTKTQVEGWLTTGMGEHRVKELDSILDKKIQEQISPATSTVSPPWSA